LGEYDPLTLDTASNLANSCRRLGQHKEAAEKYEEVYKGYLKIRGNDNYYTFETLGHLIASLTIIAEFKKAKKFAEEGYAYASASKSFGPNHSTSKQFVETIEYCDQMLKNPKKLDEMKRLVKLEAEQREDSLVVKAILQYKKKIQGVIPERRVKVPPGGMELTDYLKLCDPYIEENIQYYWVENKRKQRLRRIPHEAATVWVKSMLSCNIIQTYLPKVRRKWPTLNVDLPKEGITKEDLIGKIDANFDAQQYKIEDKSKQSLEFIKPGISRLWMRKVDRDVKGG